MFIYQGSIIANFLSQNAQQYKIPVYQRNYEWSQEQCDKLFEDIVQAGRRNTLHFCGSIVYQPIAPTKGINNSILIDGQQRLTTIYILLKALLDMSITDSEKMLSGQNLFNSDIFNQFSIDEKSKLKLKPAKENNEQLIRLINGTSTDKDKDGKIYCNYAHFCELIGSELENGVAIADIYRGISLLTVAVIQLDQNDLAQEIFERINSTGVPLSLQDLIRNYILMTDEDQDALYEKYWLNIESLLNREQLTAFFMDYLNMKVEGFTKADTAYNCFKDYYKAGKYSNEEMLKELLHYAELYHMFIYGDPKYSATVNECLKGFQYLKQTTVFIFLFSLFEDFESGEINSAELEKVLCFLLNYSIRRIVCDIGSNSLRGLYKTLYARVFANAENKKHYYDAIVSFLSQMTTKDAIIDDDSFIQQLKYNNLYKKNALCKYLLCAIENQGKEKIDTNLLTIEHIMPQNRNLSTAWQKMLGEKWGEVHEKYIHTLGNLTLTGYNSELGDKPFTEKQELLSEKNTKVVCLYEDVKGLEVWNETAIEKRADRLSKKIVELFPIIQPKVAIEFKDPKYHEYSCDDPDTATYKSPNYYVIQGERIAVTSFTEMLHSFVEKLYSIDSSIIERLASNNEKVLYWSQTVLLSYDHEKVYGDYRLANTGIFIGSGYSAAYIMYTIRALLKIYEIDSGDFVYSARDTKSPENNEIP